MKSKFSFKSRSALAGLLASCLLALAPAPAKAAGGSDVLENGIMLLLFNGTTFDNIAENDSTSPATDIYVSLHSADPTDSGDQTTSECAYTDYARVAVPRTSGGWTVTGNSVSPVDNIDFPEASAGSCSATYACAGELASGAGDLYLCFPTSVTLSITAGVIPRISTSTAWTID